MYFMNKTSSIIVLYNASVHKRESTVIVDFHLVCKKLVAIFNDNLSSTLDAFALLAELAVIKLVYNWRKYNEMLQQTVLLKVRSLKALKIASQIMAKYALKNKLTT
jgi:hypothetical protein